MQERDPSLSGPRPGTPESGGQAEAETPAAEPRGEAMPSPQEIIRTLELQAQEHYDAWLRAKAEADNVRKRAQADIANAHKYALESIAAELLPVRDALEAALAADNATTEALRQGVELTLKQLNTAFEKAAIQQIDPAGDKFDPHRHQAMTTVDSDKPANTIVHVLQKGYLLHDRMLRPALVTVSKAQDT